jgi:hypothetical protein
VLVCRASRLRCDGAPGCTRRRLRVLESCRTRRPVVTISSPIEEREDEEGWEEISTQDSRAVSKLPKKGSAVLPSLRSRGGIPSERAMLANVGEGL